MIFEEAPVDEIAALQSYSKKMSQNKVLKITDSTLNKTRAV